MGDSQTIAALVVSHNRKALLHDCLRALLAQSRRLDCIVVVNNCSTDGTVEMLRRDFGAETSIHTIASSDDDGWSGGLHKGMPSVLAGGFDWVWLLNDDGCPHPDALERLLNAGPAGRKDTVALATKVVDRKRNVLPGHGVFDCRPRFFVLRQYPSIVYLARDRYAAGDVRIGWSTGFGLLVRLDAIRKAGMPKKAFLFWFDDIDWTLRLARHGAIWLIPAAVVIDNFRSDWPQSQRNRMANRIFGTKRRQIPLDEYWKEIHGFRNCSWIMRHYGCDPSAAFIVRLILVSLATLLCDDHPIVRLRWLLALAIQGRTGKFRNVSPERWQSLKALVRRRQSTFEKT